MTRLSIFEIVAVVVVAGIGIAVFAGNRPKVERFFTVNDLAPRPLDVAHAGAVLRRTRRARLTGGFVGLILGGLTGATLGTAGMIAGAGVGLLAGTMLGITLAQPRSQSSSSTPRTASLRVRDARDYLPARARPLTFGLACVVVGYAGFAMITAVGPVGRTVAVFAVGLTTIFAVPIGIAFQRRTVELRRPDVDTESVRVDDALRASALRGIHHATIGVLMCGVLLVGYGAVTTQNVTTVKVGDRVVLRVQSDSMTAVPVPFGAGDASSYRVEWTEPGGVTHSRLIRTGNESLTLGSLDVGLLLGIAYWITVLGFFGALIEWGRAAKAWRRPQMTPTALGVTA